MTESLAAESRNPMTVPSSTVPSSSLSDRVKSLQLPTAQATRHAVSEWCAWCLCLLLAAFAGWLAWEKWNPAGKAPTTAVTPPINSSANGTMPAASDDKKEGQVLYGNGYLIPAHQILVSPKVTGMVVTLNFEEGLRVKKGDVLAVLETTDYEADVRRSQAMLELSRKRLEELERGSRPAEIKQAEAELAETQANLNDLERTYTRNQDLFVKKGVTQQELLNSEANVFAMRQRVARLESTLSLLREGPRVERIEQARAEVQQAEADLAKASWRLSNCTIKAPISGTILKKNAEEGNIVNTIAVNGSYSLCEMADLSDLEVDLTVQPSDIAKVFHGQRCRVQPEAFKERSYDGYVSRLMPIGDRSKGGALPARVKVLVPAEEEGEFLKPEMQVTVLFYGDTVDPATLRKARQP
ncbi:MAG TPA: HlyD family efflux transporter periplasmic adaptor subunit [Planctomycetaceae bacterium]|nr:HlyD family efflux transporter periplasmic adaptor subunit [Planctomycetaceae bacterium]